MSWWVLLRVWETNLFEQSELDWCLPLKEQMSHFCTLSDQPVTFNARADWFLSGTADKISGTKLACHSRRSNSRLRRELREWWKKSHFVCTVRRIGTPGTGYVPNVLIRENNFTGAWPAIGMLSCKCRLFSGRRHVCIRGLRIAEIWL